MGTLLSRLKNGLKEVVQLLGKDIVLFLCFSILVGISLFFVEYGFVYLLQAFILTLGVGQASGFALPTWVPTTPKNIYILFLAVGSFRIILIQFKVYLGMMANQVFLRRFRNNILQYAVTNATRVSSHEVFSIFTDTLARSGSVVIESVSLIISLVTSLLLLIVGLRIAPHEMLIGLGIALLVVIPLRKISRIALKYGMSLNKSWESTSKILLEGIRHHYFFKTHGLIKAQVEKGKKEIELYEGNHQSYFLLTSIKNVIPQIIGLFLLLFLSFAGQNYFQTNGSSLIAFLYLFLRISQTASEAMVLINNIAFNFPSIRELRKWDATHRLDAQLVDEAYTAMPTINEMKLEHVSFSYNDLPLLKDINLHVKKGDVLIMDAPSGAGKSTLIGLILNILEPKSGKIFINSQDISSFKNSFRSQVSYVGPDPYLLNDSVRSNLTYGLGDLKVSDDEIWSLLKLTRSDEFVRAFKQGLDEILNEHTQLSTGQKQRLAITRGLLRKPQLLILDEATANLDQKLEKEIAILIKERMQDGIVILVSHKGYIKDIATKILLLDQTEK